MPEYWQLLTFSSVVEEYEIKHACLSSHRYVIGTQCDRGWASLSGKRVIIVTNESAHGSSSILQKSWTHSYKELTVRSEEGTVLGHLRMKNRVA